MLNRSLPSAPLRDFVGHYWLSLDNRTPTFAALPDGAVDLVIEVRGSSGVGWVYGTTTTRTEVILGQGSHYLGIRFRPGCSRHFLAAAAHELTDACEPARGLILFGLGNVPERIGRGDVFERLDDVLERHVARRQPARARIDAAAACFGRSRRQFERAFLSTVKRLADLSPAAYARSDVAFLQNQSAPPPDNGPA